MNQNFFKKTLPHLIAKFEKASGERTFWTNSIFGGMQSYQMEQVKDTHFRQF